MASTFCGLRLSDPKMVAQTGRNLFNEQRQVGIIVTLRDGGNADPIILQPHQRDDFSEVVQQLAEQYPHGRVDVSTHKFGD